jgi:hypothetical protein
MREFSDSERIPGGVASEAPTEGLEPAPRWVPWAFSVFAGVWAFGSLTLLGHKGPNTNYPTLLIMSVAAFTAARIATYILRRFNAGGMIVTGGLLTAPIFGILVGFYWLYAASVAPPRPYTPPTTVLDLISTVLNGAFLVTLFVTPVLPVRHSGGVRAGVVRL